MNPLLKHGSLNHKIEISTGWDNFHIVFSIPQACVRVGNRVKFQFRQYSFTAEFRCEVDGCLSRLQHYRLVNVYSATLYRAEWDWHPFSSSGTIERRATPLIHPSNSNSGYRNPAWEVYSDTLYVAVDQSEWLVWPYTWHSNYLCYYSKQGCNLWLFPLLI